MIKKISIFLRNFFTVKIWGIPRENLTSSKASLLKIARIITLSVSSFLKDKCQLRASALTFYTLLSIVPLFAMAFGIAKGFGLSKVLENNLREKLENTPDQAIILERIIEFANSLLEHTQGGIIAGVGVLILFWSALKLLGNIEAAFNDIWGVAQARSFIRKVSDYLSIIVVCPILLIISSSATVIISQQLNSLVGYLFEFLPILSELQFLTTLILALLPYAVLWLLFTFIYIFIPNTKVNFFASFFAAIIAGTIFQCFQWLYIHFQIYLNSYNAIYGSFSALPLFLFWLQISWLIILFGAQIAYAIQHVHQYQYAPLFNNLSECKQRVLALGVMQILISNFKSETSDQLYITNNYLSDELNLPTKVINDILAKLIEAKLVSASTTSKNIEHYQVARSIDQLSIAGILRRLDCAGQDQLPIELSPKLKEIEAEYKKQCIYQKDSSLEKSLV